VIPFDSVNLGQVAVDQKFTLTFIWNHPSHEYIFRVNNGPAISKSYGTTADSSPPGSPGGGIHVLVLPANCGGAKTTADAALEVRLVETNSSATIP
jgi:hypothetical protein